MRVKGGRCSVVAVTFMSRDLGNHVLCRVRHLVNRIVVFLESRVFSSPAKLLPEGGTAWGTRGHFKRTGISFGINLRGKGISLLLRERWNLSIGKSGKSAILCFKGTCSHPFLPFSPPPGDP